MLSNVIWSLVVIVNLYVVFRRLSRLGKKDQAKVVEMKTEVDLTEDFYTEKEIENKFIEKHLKRIKEIQAELSKKSK